jgi:four helix bundle protein
VKVSDYKQLKVWQKGIEVVDKVYLLTDKFPREEIYSLTAQMRRAAVSIPSNIAEGFVRGHPKEYRQFLYISLGSCAELDTQSIIAHRRQYMTDTDLRELAEDLDHEARMLTKLISRVDGDASDKRRETSDEIC